MQMDSVILQLFCSLYLPLIWQVDRAERRERMARRRVGRASGASRPCTTGPSECVAPSIGGSDAPTDR